MSDYTELDALRDVHNALSKLDDEASRARVLVWANDKFGTGLSSAPSNEGGGATGSSEVQGSTRTRKRAPAKKKAGGSKKKTAGTPKFSKDLDLKPRGKEAFVDFAQRLSPKSNHEKCTVSVYYLKRVLERANVNTDDVYTCFKRASWRVPADLRNAMHLTSNRKGWLDTSEMTDIDVTPAGENLVEHDLVPSDTD